MNLFPTTVRTPDGRTLREVRLRYYGSLGTVAWHWAGGTRPVVLARGPGRPTSDGEVHTLVDDAGAEWTFTEAKGCGCSNPLKHHSPPHPDTQAGARRTFAS